MLSLQIIKSKNCLKQNATLSLSQKLNKINENVLLKEPYYVFNFECNNSLNSHSSSGISLGLRMCQTRVSCQRQATGAVAPVVLVDMSLK